MKKEFKILSLEELEQLNLEERNIYYKEFCSILLQGLNRMAPKEQKEYYDEYLTVLLDELDRMSNEDKKGEKNYYTIEFKALLLSEYKRIITLKQQDKNEFEVLSTKEEQKLTKEELDKYYRGYREYVLNRKRTNTSLGATTIAPKLNKPTIKIAETIIPLLTSEGVIHEFEGIKNIPDGPVLFAHNHQGMLDNFSWIPEIRRPCVLLHGSEVKKILLTVQVNSGIIGVKKGDSIDNANAKLDEINVLLNGTSMFHCPESTWDLSPNKLHLPMRRGPIDIAMKANVPIIPVIHEYIYEDVYKNGKPKFVITKIISRYGNPIYVPYYQSTLLENNQQIEYDERNQGPLENYLNDYLEELSAQMATMRFEIIKRKGQFSRADYDETEYIKFIGKSYKDLTMAGLDWQKETDNIFVEGYKVIENPKGEKIKNGISGSDKYAFTYKNEPDINERGDILPHPEIRRLYGIEIKNRIQALVSHGMPLETIKDAFSNSFIDLERTGYGLLSKPGEKNLSKRRRPA